MGDKLIKCPRCGAENLSGSVYCSKCGEKLEKSSGKQVNRKRIASILVTVCVIIIVLGAIKIGGPWIGEMIQPSPSPTPETSTGTTVIETDVPYADAPETDKDSDGIPDSADACYNPGCDIIDQSGCPLDSDGDDLPDCYDECIYEAGERTNKGCPVEADEHPRIIGWEGNIPIIDWRYADQFYGQEVIVEGTIVNTYNSGNACFLNFHTDWKNYFTAVIFQNKFYKFPANPEQYYKGKKVHVRGKIQEYEGAPQIILEDPSQIEIIG
jgi:predicted nucleic acid-binding Zn ribbon protein